MKVYVIIHSTGFGSEPAEYFRSKARAKARACELLRTVKKERGGLYRCGAVITGSIHRDMRATVNVGARGGYWVLARVSIEERDTYNLGFFRFSD